jgi:hypothetical protein
MSNNFVDIFERIGSDEYFNYFKENSEKRKNINEIYNRNLKYLDGHSTRAWKKPRSGLRARGARDSRVVSRSDYETRRKVIVVENCALVAIFGRRMNRAKLTVTSSGPRLNGRDAVQSYPGM